MKQEGIYKRFVDARQQAVSWKLAQQKRAGQRKKRGTGSKSKEAAPGGVHKKGVLQNLTTCSTPFYDGS